MKKKIDKIRVNVLAQQKAKLMNMHRCDSQTTIVQSKRWFTKTSHHMPMILYKTTLNDTNLGGTRKLGEGEGGGCIQMPHLHFMGFG